MWGVQPQWSIDKISRQLLYEPDYAWSGSKHQDTQPKPPTESKQAELSPASSTHSSVVDLSAQDASSDSEFEEVFESHELPPASFDEGNKSQAPQPLAYLGAHKKKLIERGKKAAASATEKGRKAAASATEKVQQALLGTSKMDAGSSNEYGDLDWQQAGHNADAQDLAGPGAHGNLECNVDKPQKEGEGTQNPYISYAVTTNVSIFRAVSVTIPFANNIARRPTSNHFNPPNPPSAAASPTSSSSTRLSAKNTHSAPCRLCRTSITCHTCEATDSGRTSPPAARTHSTDS